MEVGHWQASAHSLRPIRRPRPMHRHADLQSSAECCRLSSWDLPIDISIDWSDVQVLQSHQNPLTANLVNGYLTHIANTHLETSYLSPPSVLILPSNAYADWVHVGPQHRSSQWSRYSRRPPVTHDIFTILPVQLSGDRWVIVVWIYGSDLIRHAGKRGARFLNEEINTQIMILHWGNKTDNELNLVMDNVRSLFQTWVKERVSENDYNSVYVRLLPIRTLIYCASVTYSSFLCSFLLTPSGMTARM